MPKAQLTHVMTPEEKCRLSVYLDHQAEISDALACTLRTKARYLREEAAQELEDATKALAAQAFRPDSSHTP